MSLLMFYPIAWVAVVSAAVIPYQPFEKQADPYGFMLERYPTAAEIDSALERMRLRLPQLEQTGIYSDRRSPQERQEIEVLVEDWRQVNGAIAPFLGEWTTIEESLAIFPTAIPGEVCVIDFDANGTNFYKGRVMDGHLYTDVYRVFALDGRFLANIAVYPGEVGAYEYDNPRPLRDPGTSSYFVETAPDVVAQFHREGCLIQTP